MLKRTLTALLLIPPVVYLIGWSPKWLFLLAVVAAVILALREYFGLCRAMGFKVFSLVGYAVGALLCVVQTFPVRGGILALTFLILSSVLLISTLALHKSTELRDYLAATSATIFGILYVGLSLSCLIPIRFTSYSDQGLVSIGRFGSTISPGPVFLLMLFLVIWAGDICAYLVGRPFGRTPFFARISPRKTWEGAIAGLAGSLLVAWALEYGYIKAFGGIPFGWIPFGTKTIILLAAWVAVAGQVGDLVESAIKRGANQKDSGALLPGHGGFLDRIDSLLFAAPALWLAMFILGWLS
jgi:phosphatidate cytidylyltransferase